MTFSFQQDSVLVFYFTMAFHKKLYNCCQDIITIFICPHGNGAFLLPFYFHHILFMSFSTVCITISITGAYIPEGHQLAPFYTMSLSNSLKALRSLCLFGSQNVMHRQIVNVTDPAAFQHFKVYVTLPSFVANHPCNSPMVF